MKEQHSQDLREPLIQPEKLPIEQEQIPPISILKLFSFAQTIDVIYIIVGTIASLGAGLTFPFFVIFFGDITMIFIQSNRHNAEHDGLQIAIKFFVIGGATWLLNFLGIYCWNKTGIRQLHQYKKKYYQALLLQQIAYYDSIDTNKLSTELVGNITAIESIMNQKVSTLLAVIVTTLFGFIYAFVKCWQLSLVLTATLPLLLVGGFLFTKALMLLSEKNKVSYENAAGVAEQALVGIKTVKSLVGESFELKKFTQALQVSYKKALKYTFFSHAAFGIMIFIFLGVYALGFWYGKTLIIDDPVQYDSAKIIGTFFCFIIGGSSIGQIAPLLKGVTDAKVAGAKFFQLLDREQTLKQKTSDGVSVGHIKSLKLEKVKFQYPKLKEKEKNTQQEEKNVLKNISIDFQKNKVTALVGQSGSGKSTIVQLLMRFYDPSSGNVLVNGNSLTDINVEDFRRKIGFVGQEPVLFSMSIKENIKLAQPNISDQQLVESLKKANAMRFVEKMEKGTDTYVGTGGTQLSGGQKQRIAIARAICRKPQILVLDEATSALDRKNEKEIQKTLKKLSQGNITTVVIAHRLSTIMNADKIVVMKKGQVVQEGTHEQLLAKQGYYCQLFKTQMQAQRQQGQIQQQAEQMEEQQIITSQQTSKIIKAQEKDEKEEVPQFPPQKLDGVFTKLLIYSKSYFIFYVIGIVMALIRGAIFPLFNVTLSNVMALLPEAYKPQNDKQINLYCILFGVVAFVGGLVTFLGQMSFGIIGEKTVYNMRIQTFGKLLKLPVSYFDKAANTPGGISAKMAEDTYQIHNMTTGIIAVIILNVSTLVTSLGFAFYNTWLLTICVLVTSPLLVVANGIQMSVLKKMTSQSSEVQKNIGSMVSDTCGNARTVKSFGQNQAFLDRFVGQLIKIQSVGEKKALATAILQGISKAMVIFVEGLMFYIAAVLYQNQMINQSKSIYIAIFSIIFAAAGIGNNSAFMPDMAKCKVAGARIFEVLQAKDQKQKADQQGKQLQRQLKGNFEFKNVNFKYPQRDAIVLENFNLVIKQGDKVGLVGPSGSGKSTIVQILMRFYDIQSGQILVDGVPIQDYELYHYRKQLGLVSQQPQLFLGTVKENIQYEHSQSVDVLKRYTDIAFATNFIQEWNEGFNKDVGQKGTQVSGGQKQRIALSRCLARNPTVFLMDQFTSALDADSQKIVFNNLKPIIKGKTAISIAHRLSTIEDANRVIMMRSGKIIQQGSYEQLMNLKGNFYMMAKGLQ